MTLPVEGGRAAGAARHRDAVAVVGGKNQVLGRRDLVERAHDDMWPEEPVVGCGGDKVVCANPLRLPAGIEVLHPPLPRLLWQPSDRVAPVRALIVETATINGERGAHPVARQAADHGGHVAAPAPTGDADARPIHVRLRAQERQAVERRDHAIKQDVARGVWLHGEEAPLLRRPRPRGRGLAHVADARLVLAEGDVAPLSPGLHRGRGGIRVAAAAMADQNPRIPAGRRGACQDAVDDHLLPGGQLPVEELQAGDLHAFLRLLLQHLQNAWRGIRQVGLEDRGRALCRAPCEEYRNQNRPQHPPALAMGQGHRAAGEREEQRILLRRSVHLHSLFHLYHAEPGRD